VADGIRDTREVADGIILVNGVVLGRGPAVVSNRGFPCGGIIATIRGKVIV
jgi:hypothetical protein